MQPIQLVFPCLRGSSDVFIYYDTDKFWLVVAPNSLRLDLQVSIHNVNRPDHDISHVTRRYYSHTCTLYNHICTLYNHICTLYNHICTLYNHICTLTLTNHSSIEPSVRMFPAHDFVAPIFWSLDLSLWRTVIREPCCSNVTETQRDRLLIAIIIYNFLLWIMYWYLLWMWKSWNITWSCEVSGWKVEHVTRVPLVKTPVEIEQDVTLRISK